jgi:septum formation topological specificity factor MinE
VFNLKKSSIENERAKEIITLDKKRYIHFTVEESIKNQILSVLKNYMDVEISSCVCKINQEKEEYKFLFEINIDRVKDFIYF